MRPSIPKSMKRAIVVTAMVAATCVAVLGASKAAPIAPLPATNTNNVVQAWYWHRHYYPYHWHHHYWHHRYWRYHHWYYW